MRWTKAEHDKFRKDWLLERMGHKWNEAAPSRCSLCGAKFGPGNVRRVCPKRRKPGRWKMHFGRAVLREQYPPQEPIKRTAAWMVMQMDAIRREVAREPRFKDDLRYWKYHRLARRYRRLMREWWALPAAEVSPFLMCPRHDPTNYSSTLGADITRRRNKLLARVAKEQRRVVREGDCTYTFDVNAKWKGLPLFRDDEAVA